ncbi:HK97 family phage prohead protease [Psychrobacter glaciei]|uniref:HK97 family phage prohead protease n=1 Tax=Psychrobacter glaciei TaxID=619771 RepID=UPI001F06157D|nr:HK97 family phage prohead protease [Psychrobacter glaciei]MCH1781743.1 HK97 family phage prohead protease [Psychrobacter glaciei]
MNKHSLQMLHCRDSRSELLESVSTRRMPIVDASIRFAELSSGEAVTHIFEGYAVKWNSINSHGEKFVRGAFADMVTAINEGTKVVHMYYNHGWRNFFDVNAAMRVGRWIEFEEDDIGLRVKGELTTGLHLANAVGAMMRHLTVDGLSICFYNISELDYEERDDHVLIKRVDLFEISVVDEPSDRSARINRQAETINNLADERDACDMLTKLGLDQIDARHFITKLDSIMGTRADDPSKDDDPFAFLDK